MYGACNQLFACSRFTRDKDRRIAWRDFGDTREYAIQSGRGSNNLFKHRSLIDLLAKGNVFLLKPLLSSLAFIKMNEQTGTKRKSGCLLPLFQTNAVVIERNAVSIKTFTTGSIYPHLLGREVQNLPELCFLPADPFFGSLSLGDVRHRPDKLEGARLVFHCVSHDVD